MAKKSKPKATKPAINPETPAKILRAIAESGSPADSEALLSDLIDVIGGTRRLAQMIFRAYEESPRGGMASSAFST